MGTFAVIFDTNTLISAYGFGGTPEDAVKIDFHSDVEVFVPPDIIEEYERVLGYEHLPFSEEEQSNLIPEFRQLTGARLETTTPDLEIVDVDPDDDKFVELAAATGADYLVSGDEHLLCLGSYEGTDILSSRAFLDETEKVPPEAPLSALD